MNKSFDKLLSRDDKDIRNVQSIEKNETIKIEEIFENNLVNQKAQENTELNPTTQEYIDELWKTQNTKKLKSPKTSLIISKKMNMKRAIKYQTNEVKILDELSK